MIEVMWTGSADLLTKPWTPSFNAVRSTPGRACRVSMRITCSGRSRRISATAPRPSTLTDEWREW